MHIIVLLYHEIYKLYHLYVNLTKLVLRIILILYGF
jgi:hypothetical protein